VLAQSNPTTKVNKVQLGLKFLELHGRVSDKWYRRTLTELAQGGESIVVVAGLQHEAAMVEGLQGITIDDFEMRRALFQEIKTMVENYKIKKRG
jgi:hypothetical protein